MFVMAAHTGARRSEILRAQIEDVQDDSIVIQERKRVRGKSSTRRVPISRRLHAALGAWRHEHPGGPHLFCQMEVERSRRNRLAREPITRNEAVDHFKRAVANSTWSMLPGWHCLRHSFISNCASKGVDQRMIDEWVGRTAEEMRRRYRHLFLRRSEKRSIQSSDRQQSFSPNPKQLVVTDHPFLGPAASARAFFGTDPAVSAPFANAVR